MLFCCCHCGFNFSSGLVPMHDKTVFIKQSFLIIIAVDICISLSCCNIVLYPLNIRGVECATLLWVFSQGNNLIKVCKGVSGGWLKRTSALTLLFYDFFCA
jgi:hypothetical protein